MKEKCNAMQKYKYNHFIIKIIGRALRNILKLKSRGLTIIAEYDPQRLEKLTYLKD